MSDLKAVVVELLVPRRWFGLLGLRVEVVDGGAVDVHDAAAGRRAEAVRRRAARLRLHDLQRHIQRDQEARF